MDEWKPVFIFVRIEDLWRNPERLDAMVNACIDSMEMQMIGIKY